MNPVWWVAILGMGGMLGVLPEASAQTVDINGTGQFCFLNYTSSLSDTWERCGFTSQGGDWLSALISPYQWITGGFFSSILVGVIIIGVWITTRNFLYPLFAGIIFMPFAYFLFPSHFLNQVFILAIAAGALALYKIVLRGTKEY